MHRSLALERSPAVVVAVVDIVDCILGRHIGRWWGHMGFVEHPQGVAMLGFAAAEIPTAAPVAGFYQCSQVAWLCSVMRFFA